MPQLETPDELAEQIADWCGVYGSGPDGDHPKDCKCRNCFTFEVEQRIRQSVNNEKIIEAQT